MKRPGKEKKMRGQSEEEKFLRKQRRRLFFVSLGEFFLMTAAVLLFAALTFAGFVLAENNTKKIGGFPEQRSVFAVERQGKALSLEIFGGNYFLPLP